MATAAPRDPFDPVEWVEHRNTSSPAPGQLAKTSGTSDESWNAGAAGSGVLWGDGEVRFRFCQVDDVRVGLSGNDTGTDPDWIEFAIASQGDGKFGVYEGGEFRGIRGSYEPTDVFSIRRVGTRIRYEKNGKVFYRSTRPSKAPLRVGASFRRLNTKIAECAQSGFTRWWDDRRHRKVHPAVHAEELTLEHLVTDFTGQEPLSPVLHRNGSTFWAFVARGGGSGQPNERVAASGELQVVVMQKKGAAAAVSHVVRIGVALDAGHVGPSLGIDRSGYLHLVCNQHSAPSWQYYRSKHPVAAPGASEDITGGFDSRGDDPGRTLPQTRATYVRFVHDRRGRLYATYRFYTRNAPIWHNGIMAAALAVYDEQAPRGPRWSALGGIAYIPADPAPFVSELGSAYGDASKGLTFRVADPTIPGPYGYRTHPATGKRVPPWAYAGVPPLGEDERPKALFYDVGGASRFLAPAVPHIAVRGKQVVFDPDERKKYDGRKEASLPWDVSNVAWTLAAENRPAFHAYQAYKYDIKFDRANRMHVVCQIKSVEYAGGKPAYRCTPQYSTHLVYASSSDGGTTFTRADGSPVTLPMTTLPGTTPGDAGLMSVANSGAVASHSSTGVEGSIEFSSDVAFLGDGSPVILYRVLAEPGRWETRVRRWSASRRQWVGQGKREYWRGVSDLGSGGWMNDHRGQLYSFSPGAGRAWLRTTTDDGKTWVRIAVLKPGNNHHVDLHALASSGVFVYQETVLNAEGKTRDARVRVLPLRRR